jgi:hypothetical protein
MRVATATVVLAVTGILVWAGTSAVAAPSEGAACPAGTKRAVIGGKVKCLRAGQPCQARYQAVYRKRGFTCVAGHLRKRVVTPPPEPPAPPPPPTPPPPPAQPGHYKGTTSQLTVIEMDVTAAGTTVTHIVTGQINEGCTPHASLYGGSFQSGNALVPLSPDGTFIIDFDYRGTVGESPSTGHFNLTGHFNGLTATGTLEDSTSFTDNGVAYACGSGRQTWTATRVS